MITIKERVSRLEPMLDILVLIFGVGITEEPTELACLDGIILIYHDPLARHPQAHQGGRMNEEHEDGFGSDLDLAGSALANLENLGNNGASSHPMYKITYLQLKALVDRMIKR